MTLASKRGGSLLNSRNTMKVADIAAKAWDAGLVEEINGLYVTDYVNRMAAHAVRTLLWADCTGYDLTLAENATADEISNGDCDIELPYAHTEYDADNLDASDREAIWGDCEDFIRSAWPYLIAENCDPEQAGHDFHLTRNGHGAGFWDGDHKYGDSLTQLCKGYGDISVQVGIDGDGYAVDFQLTH